MAVNYEELLQDWRIEVESASESLMGIAGAIQDGKLDGRQDQCYRTRDRLLKLLHQMRTHAEALLNPDPWRPLVDLEEKHKDGRIIDLWVRDYADGGFRVPDCKWGTPWSGAAPCWLELKPHPDALHDWEWQPIDFVPTHFRELKGPGQ